MIEKGVGRDAIGVDVVDVVDVIDSDFAVNRVGEIPDR